MPVSVQQFTHMYKDTALPVSMTDISRRWLYEREIRDFLNLAVTPGVVLGDLLVGGGVRGQLPGELLDGFQNLMGDKADTIPEIEALLISKLELGDASVLGMINKIKGQIGENYFVEAAHDMGLNAQLATSGSQEGWDVVIRDPGNGLDQYIQVKTYADPDNVIHHIQSVSEKLDAGIIMDGDHVVRSIDFAVPSDIYAELADKVKSLGLSAKIIPFDLSATQAADFVQDGFNAVGIGSVENLLSRVALGSASALAIHTLIYGVWLRKQAKETEGMIKHVSTQGVLSSTGMAIALTTETALKGLGLATGSLPATGLIVASSMAARGVFRRMIARDTYEDWVQVETDRLKSTMAVLGQPGPKLLSPFNNK